MFRFTIRDLLWLMVVVRLIAVWWMEHREKVVMMEAMHEIWISSNGWNATSGS